ncbi:lipid II flippase MurJ [Pseudolysinimonas sp.]|uniref:murein biosynthesis integral membrane protein MurJ n=1 Tax=Pseudolysinimonas sp. TaxID=2680009 RepID=UPI00286BEE8C|nr:lipid II flippase MurJ [Pseudolysinimonas sp.]
MSGTVGRASAALASGTIVSRLLGFVNASVLAYVIGVRGSGPNAFALANQLPTYVYAIVAGGLLSAVLVPHIVKAATQADGGQSFVNRLVTLGVTAFVATTALATLAAPLIVRLYALGGGDDALAGGGLDLAIVLAYWCLPQILFYAVYALVGEVLNARGIFGPAAWAPALNNVVMIGVLVLFGVLYGVSPAHRDPATWDATRIAMLAGGATLGVALQALLLMLFWRRTGLRFHPDFRWRGVGLGAPARAAGWVFGMVLVIQLTNFVQTNVAATADSSDASLAVLRVTWLIFMLSHSIIAISIATPYFTRMSAAVRDNDIPAVRADLSASLRTIGMLVAAAGAALAAAALPFSAFFAQDPAEARVIAIVLLGFLVGLVPFSTLYVVQRAYYALGDTRTPFLLQIVQAAIFIAGALAMLAAPSAWIAAGIGLATSVSVIVQAIVAAVILRNRLGGGGGAIVRRFGVFALTSIPSAGAGVGVLALMGGFDEAGFATAGQWQGIVTTAIVGASVILVFFGVLAATRAPELRGLRSSLRRNGKAAGSEISDT